MSFKHANPQLMQASEREEDMLPLDPSCPHPLPIQAPLHRKNSVFENNRARLEGKTVIAKRKSDVR